MDKQERLSFEGCAKLPSFQRKVEQSKEIIREALAIGPAYVAVSWGKDSIVMLHLCQQIDPGIHAISFGHPERELISNYQETERTYCDRFPTQLTTISMDGDHVPAKIAKARLWEQYSIAFVGLRKEESAKRKIALCKHGPNYQYKAGHWRSCPLLNWKTIDVWAYVVANNLPYLKAYDLGADRTTDHVSKSSKRDYQATRLEEFRLIAPEYYQYLQTHFPETFYAAN